MGVALIQSVRTPFVRLEEVGPSPQLRALHLLMMTSPSRSPIFTVLSQTRASVPTTTFNFPRRSPSFVTLASAADVARDRFPIFDAERTEPFAEGYFLLSEQNAGPNR